MTQPPPQGLPLSELTRQLSAVEATLAVPLAGSGDVWVKDVRQDSRAVNPGDLFVARAGGRVSGASFVTQAESRGAVAILAHRDTPLPATRLPVLRVSSDQVALALAAECVQHHPSRDVCVIGVTGTNGKTTTASLVVDSLSAAGARVARLGTLGYSFEQTVVEGALTTPEADDISRYLAVARDAGATHMVLEASSIALSQRRVDGLHFGVAAFSNLTQDHLDFHGSLAEYGAAKARLFEELGPVHRVINVADAFGAALAQRQSGTVLRVGRSAPADVFPEQVSLTGRGLAAKINVCGRKLALTCPLVGRHNLDNVLLTLGIGVVLGLDENQLAAGIAHAAQVPGRMERCSADVDDVIVIVDYAHTPDALANALTACRELTSKDVLCVFGCGGDRDRGKRPLMGEVAGRLGSYSIITNDNPRSENPQDIATQIERGFQAQQPHEVCLDRHTAIQMALTRAQSGDVVLIAGKGHETYQMIGAQTFHFDDREQAALALSARRARSELN